MSHDQVGDIIQPGGIEQRIVYKALASGRDSEGRYFEFEVLGVEPANQSKEIRRNERKPTR